MPPTGTSLTMARLSFTIVILMCFHVNEAKANCFLSNIKLTIKIENHAKPPYFTLRTTVEAPRQPLENFLLMAAGRDSRFRFESKMIDDFGMFVIAINGVRADPLDVTAWLPFDRLNRQLTINIRDYVPQDMETIVFRFYSFAESGDCSGPGCRTPRARLVSNNG